MAANTPQTRLASLDAMRGLAAAMVVVYHYTERYAQVHGSSPLGVRFEHGAYGVDLFFMISGFVILMTLERCTYWGDFLVSRATRLFPAYWASMALTLITIGLLGSAGLASWSVRAGDVAWNVTMLQEFVRRPSVDGVYWTLAVELRFYACMFVLWALGALCSPLRVVVVWLLLVCLQRWLPGLVRVNFVLAWIPLFAVGMVTYVASRRGWVPQCGLVLVLSLMANAAIRPVSAAAVDAAMALAFVGASRLEGARIPRILLGLGAVSYLLYLVHQNVGFALIHALGAGPPAVAVALWCTLALAWIVHISVERPAMTRIRAGWQKRRQRT